MRAIAIIAIALSLSACADSTGPSNSGSLSKTQALGISSQLFVEVGHAMSSANFTSGQSNGSTPEFSFNGTCQGGGTVTGTGTYTSTTYDLTYTPNNCKISTDRTYVISGDPNIHMTWIVPTSSTGTLNYSVSGGFKWDGGSCKLDYSIIATSADHGSIKGTMCGNSVDTTF